VFKFNQEKNSFVVIPQVVTRTKEIVRSTIRIEGVNLADVKINVETDFKLEMDTSKISSTKKLTITAEDFFEQLEKNTNKDTVTFAKQIIKDSEENGYYIEWNTGSFGIKFPDPQGSGIRVSILNVDRNSLIYLGYSEGQLKKLGLPLELSYDLAKETAEILPNTQQSSLKNGWIKYATLSDLKPVYEIFMNRVKKYTHDITFEIQKNSK
jgi:hypothetical protein